MKKLIASITAATMLSTVAYAEQDLSSYDNTKIAWGLGSSTDSSGKPLDAVNAQRKYSDMGGLFVGDNTDEQHKNLWLTFDEGYENGYTAKILDILKAKNVHAVFFVTYDYAKDNPELIRRMIDEGHTVGNHTWSHPSLPECSITKLRDELSKLHEYIKSEFGYDMYVMRPPMGEFSERVLACAKDLGYTTVLWSFAYKDWVAESQPDAEFAYNKITSGTHNGAVYLLHAVSKTNTRVLPDVIDFWRENGYIITPM